MFYQEFNKDFCAVYINSSQGTETHKALIQAREYVAKAGAFEEIKIPGGNGEIHFLYSFSATLSVELVVDSNNLADLLRMRINSDSESALERFSKTLKLPQVGNRPPSVFPRHKANGNC